MVGKCYLQGVVFLKFRGEIRSKDMEKNANKKPVQLPEGHMCRDCCGDCVFLIWSDKTSDGRIWCGKRSKYVSGGEGACGDFRQG